MGKVSHQTWNDIIGAFYLGLMVNALMVVTALPLVVLLFTTDPMHSWPLIAVAIPLSAPAMVGAFGAFRDHRDGGTTVARAFLRSWRSAWRRAVPFTAALTLAIVVLLVDMRAVSGHRWGALLLPVLVVLTVVVAATCLVGLVAYAEAPGARLTVVTKASLFLSLRRWYLTAASLFALDVQFLFFASHPALALGLSAAPVLYVVWAGSRFSLTPALGVRAPSAAV